MNYEEIKTLKEQVKYVLHTRSETRNSDAELIQVLCGMFRNKDGKPYNPIQRATSIERCRRWFNQRGQYLPTDEQIVRQRKINIQEWRTAMGYPTEQGSYTPPSEKNKPKQYKFLSKTKRGIFHLVTDLGSSLVCNCESYQHRGRCSHIDQAWEMERLKVSPQLF